MQQQRGKMFDFNKTEIIKHIKKERSYKRLLKSQNEWDLYRLISWPTLFDTNGDNSSSNNSKNKHMDKVIYQNKTILLKTKYHISIIFLSFCKYKNYLNTTVYQWNVQLLLSMWKCNCHMKINTLFLF